MFRLQWLLLLTVLMAAPVFTGEKETKPKPDEPRDEVAARAAFEKSYEEGVTAAMEEKWTVARQKLAAALRELGDASHPKKSAAQVMLNKAERSLFKDDALATADELFKLKQWPEAEEAYRKVAEVTGDTKVLIDKVNECRKELEKKYPDLKKANDLLKEKKWKDAIDVFNAVAEKTGMIRMIRDGINIANLNTEAKDLIEKGNDLLSKKQWIEAFNAFKRAGEILGTNSDSAKEISAGILKAQDGFAQDVRAKEDEKAKKP